MARKTPTISGGLLEYCNPSDRKSCIIAIGTDEWYTWLLQGHSFYFKSPHGTFTARYTERYWYAYRRRSGKLHAAYLGKSEELALERLEAASKKLAQATTMGVDEEKAPPVTTTRSVSAGTPLHNPLLITKLHIPTPRFNSISRPRLIEILQQIRHYKLITISAPAGFGKTTLLGEWASLNSLPVTWLTLDEDDNDFLRFFCYFMAALKNVSAPVGDTTLALLYVSPLPSITRMMTTLINEIAAIPKEFVFVFDDYHSIQTSSIHEALSFLLKHLPQNMHIIISSRAKSPLAITFLRTYGNVLELDVSDLRFSTEETTLFLNQTCDLNISDIAMLEELTEGWITGLQLVARSLNEKQDITELIQTFPANRCLIDYLVEVVLAPLSEPLQRFLLETSILTKLTGALCNAVIDIHDGKAYLEELERMNLFLFPLEMQPEWYCYHHLFAGLLQNYLWQMQPQHSSHLHLRASKWFESQGMVAEAVAHALSSKNIDHTTYLIGEFSKQMIMKGDAVLVLSWFKSLPQDLIFIHPKLYLAYAWALLAAAQFVALESFLHNAEYVLQVCLDSENTHAAVFYTYVFSHLETIRATLTMNMGEVDRTIEILTNLLEHSTIEDPHLLSIIKMNIGDALNVKGESRAAMQAYEEALNACERIGNRLTLIIILSSLGELQALQGQLHLAAETYQRALQVASQEGDQQTQAVSSAGKAHIFLGTLLYEWNDLDAALFHVQEGIKLCKQWGHFEHLIEGYMLLAMIHGAFHSTHKVVETMRIARELVEDMYRNNHHKKNKRLKNLANRVAVIDVWLFIGQKLTDTTDATFFDSFEDDLHLGSDFVSPHYNHSVAVHLFLQEGKFLQAQTLLGQFAFVTESKQANHCVINFFALEALVLYATGDLPAAFTSLSSALLLAETEGYKRLFLDHGSLMIALLRTAFAHNIASTHIQQLLKACGETVDSPVILSKLESSHVLSQREAEVLRLIERGFSNRDIAQELFIAIGTVKKHIENIYSKFNAKNRAQAILHAKEMNLL